MKRVPNGSSPQRLPPRKRQLRVYSIIRTNKTARGKWSTPVNSSEEEGINKEIRPRRIPYTIWKRIRIISIELGLTIPDTLDLLADLYEDLKQGKIVKASKCLEVLER